MIMNDDAMKDLDTSYFNLTTEKLPVAGGSLIVAQPFLSDEWFGRAVISLIDCAPADGATGVVLNNRMDCTLREVLDGVRAPGDAVPVYCGGPLSHDRLYFIHTLGPDIIPGARLYAPGLYIGGEFSRAVAYVNEGYPAEGFLRFFIGYSGWTAGQLRDEMLADTWAPVAAPPDAYSLLAGAGDAYWHAVVRLMGPRYRSWLAIPRDVRAN